MPNLFDTSWPSQSPFGLGKHSLSNISPCEINPLNLTVLTLPPFFKYSKLYFSINLSGIILSGGQKITKSPSLYWFKPIIQFQPFTVDIDKLSAFGFFSTFKIIKTSNIN